MKFAFAPLNCLQVRFGATFRRLQSNVYSSWSRSSIRIADLNSNDSSDRGYPRRASAQEARSRESEK